MYDNSNYADFFNASCNIYPTNNMNRERNLSNLADLQDIYSSPKMNNSNYVKVVEQDLDLENSKYHDLSENCFNCPDKLIESCMPEINCLKSGIDTNSASSNYTSSNFLSVELYPNVIHPTSNATLANSIHGNYNACTAIENSTLLPSIDYLRKDCELNHRPGSWSDSGYSYNISESDYSRFSSLSFGETSADRIYDNSDSDWRCCEDAIYDREICENERVDEICNDLSKLCCDYDDSGEIATDCVERLVDNQVSIFDVENYTPEERRILDEIAKNPDNKYVTTKALSDICRNVPSKSYNLLPKKLKKNFRTFCRKLSSGIKKNSVKNKNKSAELEKQRDFTKEKCDVTEHSSKISTPLMNAFRKFRSLSSSSRDLGQWPVKSSSKNMQRANSYSSLFGRKGSLFAGTAGDVSVHRSVSLYSLEYQLTRDEMLDEMQQIERQTSRCSKSCTELDSKTDACHCRAEIQSTNQSECVDGSVHQSTREKLSREQYDIVVAPLQINVTEQRSAHTRQVRKLSAL